MSRKVISPDQLLGEETASTGSFTVSSMLSNSTKRSVAPAALCNSLHISERAATAPATIIE